MKDLDLRMKYAVVAIHPEYAKAIYAGTKKWEFRKTGLPVNESLLLYETAPVSAITGGCMFGAELRTATIAMLELIQFTYWKDEPVGITEEALEAYAGRYGRVSAMHVATARRFETSLKLPGRPPQSWGRYPFAIDETRKMLAGF